MPDQNTLERTSFRILPVAFEDARAVDLRRQLDDDLAERYLGSHSEETPEQTAERELALRIHPEQIVATLVAVIDDGTPAGHVILRHLEEEWEVKRMVVSSAARGRGIGRALLARAVEIAAEGGAHRVLLQTGSNQPESIRLYESMGFTRIPVYEPYAATMPTSLCFEKVL